MTRDPLRILRALVDLAGKSDRRPGAIRMADVFDGGPDAEAWRRAWDEARRVVSEVS